LVVVVSFSIEVGRPMSVIQPMTDLVTWHPIKTEPQLRSWRMIQRIFMSLRREGIVFVALVT
jgi:hypothetical protein